MKSNDYGEKLDKNGYAPSIAGESGRCVFCGRTDRPLQRHEPLHGPNRTASKKLGCWVQICDLCHTRLHQRDAALDMVLKQKMQALAMEHYDWTVDEFRRMFGKSYL